MSQPNVKRSTQLICMALSLPLSTLVYAQSPTPLQTVSVIAGVTEQDTLDAANTITVMDQNEIEKTQAGDIQDLFRYQPGISVKSQPMRAGAALGSTGRGGNEGINIRGLEGNQVMIVSDGVRIPASFSFGPMVTGRGDYLEPEGYKRVEILRGPSSSLYGSEGLAGAVSFTTKDPDDLLTLGKPTQAAIRTGYSSADNGWFMTPSVAIKGEKVSAMLLYTKRDYGETQTQGTRSGEGALRTRANPQNNGSDYVLAKVVYDLNDQHQLKLSGEKLDRTLRTDVLSGRGRTTMGAMMWWDTTDLQAKDQIQRDLIKADYRYQNADNPLMQYAKVSLYHQEAKNTQYTDERRNGSMPSLSDRTRNNRYQERILGLGSVFESQFGETLQHRLNYGVDYSTNRIKELRDGTPRGTAFPVKDFPDSDYNQLGAFIQDEIVIGQFSIIPGLRYDSYELNAISKNDPLYPGLTPSKLSDSAVSAKLGFVFKQHDLLNYFAQYSEGFRAPTPSDVNSGFTNLNGMQPYQTISNPNLKPETSQLYEIGLRGRNNQLSYQLSLFHTDYKNFIENTVVRGSGTVADPLTYQSVNRSKAEVKGVEASAKWHVNSTWSVSAGYNYNEGKVVQGNGQKTDLRTIDPAKLIAGVRFDQTHYGLELIATHVERKTNPTPTNWSPGGYTNLDLLADFHISKHWQIQAGVYNLTDAKYVHWADVRDLAQNSQVKDAYTQPGRNLKLNVNYQF